MKKKTTYYWMTDLKRFGKYDGQNYYILINGKWMSDNDRIIFGKLIGYDEFEPDDSPYAIGSTSVMDTIEEITEEQFNEMYNSEKYIALFPYDSFWYRNDDLLEYLENKIGTSNLTMIGGRPCVGKTAFMINVANYFVSRGYNVFVFSIEMPTIQWTRHYFQTSFDLTYESFHMKNNVLSLSDSVNEQTEAELVKHAQTAMLKYLCIDDSPSLTVKHILNYMKKNGTGPKDIILIDYFQLITPEEREDNKENEYIVIAKQLKELSVSLCNPIMVLSQFPPRHPADYYESLAVYDPYLPFIDTAITISDLEPYEYEDRIRDLQLIVMKDSIINSKIFNYKFYTDTGRFIQTV